MKKTLIRDVYLDGFLLAAGTELTDEQAERITNPRATEDLSIEGQDGKKAAEQQRVEDGYPTGEPVRDVVDSSINRKPTKATNR